MIYVAIGDIHGCLTQLETLWNNIDKYLKEYHPSDDIRIIFLGDYIDRGPDSKGVVQFLINLQKTFPYEFIFLKGNHEDMFLKKDELFIHYGMKTLESYGINLEKYIENEIIDWIPVEHLEFYSNLQTYYKDNNACLFFCHGRIDQTIDLDMQEENVLLWTRFHKDYNKLGEWKVIHGHTPPNFEMLPHRINLDTACVFGGSLTAIVLDTVKKNWVLQQVDGLERRRKY